MAVTNGWGQAAKNNTNGYGKLATNNIGAGSIYEDSYAGDTALIGVSAAFSYSASSFTQVDSNPTPTITGATGGTFSGTSGLVFVSTSTGEINLSASTIAAHVVTYTVSGVSADFSLSVTAAPFANQFSFEFDGVDEYIDLASSSTAITDWTQPYTISMWVKYTVSLSFDLMATFGIETGSAATSRYIMIGGSSGYLFTGVGDTDGGSTNIHFNIGSNLNDGNWHNIVYVGDGTSGDFPAVYIDGVLENHSGGTTNLFNSSTYLNVVGTGSTATGRYFNGLIDEVAVFNSALSQTDINTIYGSGIPTDISSLNPNGWWRMGEQATFSNPGGTGDWTLTDQGSGGNNATSVNMEEADRKTNTPASFNQFSFDFDGVDEFLQIGQTTDVITDFKQPWSVSWWAKWSTQVSVLFGNGFWQLGNIASGNIVQLCAHIDASGTGGQISVSHGYSMSPIIERGFGSGLNDNQWHHYCVTGDGSAGNFIVYIDGIVQTQTGGSTSSAYSTSSNNNIGRMKFGSSVRPLTGSMDEMSIWNTELSSSAVTEIYNSGVPNNLNSHTNVSNLISWYRMGEEATFSGGSWTLTDQGSGGNNATSNNMEEADRKADTP